MLLEARTPAAADAATSVAPIRRTIAIVPPWVGLGRGRWVVPAWDASDAEAPPPQLVDVHRDDDRRSDEHLLPERVHLLDHEAVLEDGRDERADDRAEDRADA